MRSIKVNILLKIYFVHQLLKRKVKLWQVGSFFKILVIIWEQGRRNWGCYSISSFWYIVVWNHHNSITYIQPSWVCSSTPKLLHLPPHFDSTFPKISHRYVCSHLYYYSFRQNFPPVRLFRTLEYIYEKSESCKQSQVL